MSSADIIKSMFDYTKETYDVLEELGASMPIDKNVENLAPTIDSLGGGGWNPAKPTLEGLKEAVDNDVDVPIGTEIPDIWNGANNPLIVAQKLDSSNNSSYGGAVGYILVRKFAEKTNQPFANSGSTAYNGSNIQSFLNNAYLNNCSDTLKGMISEITIPQYNGSSMTQIADQKWFLMSATELYGQGKGTEGFAWDYWKQKTGSPKADNGANNGRKVTDSTGIDAWWQTRSWYSAFYTYILRNTGAIAGEGAPTYVYDTLPACFVAKSTPPSPVEPGSLADLKAQLKTGTAKDNFPVGKEIPDKWNGQDNPLIVAQYLDSSNNLAYDKAEGAILVRKYAEPVSERYNSSGFTDYGLSSVRQYLVDTLNADGYYAKCSDELKAVIAPLRFVAINDDERELTYEDLWFLMSDTEVYGPGYYGTEGFAWDYWKQKTGLSAPSGSANAGRVVKGRNGTVYSAWLRSLWSGSLMCLIGNSGTITYGSPSGLAAILPACFVSKE